MLNVVVNFLKERCNGEKPVLLAFSGGPDSLALFHLLIESCHAKKFAVAHVDHGWREESASEAREIASMAEKYQLTFHLKTLDPAAMSGNLESACREERYRFFASLCKEHDYQGVLLAHHADDVAETVLKRALEGVALPYLHALRPEVVIHGVKVWRPFLSVSKKQLLNWLEERKLKGFEDKTNLDPRFLRGRFRAQLLPYLSEMFGKKISSGLCQLSQEAGELRDYLDDRIAPYLDDLVDKGTGEYTLDLRKHCPSHLFELKYLIRQFCKKGDFMLSRDCVHKAAVFLLKKSFNKVFLTKHGKLKIHGGMIHLKKLAVDGE